MLVVITVKTSFVEAIDPLGVADAGKGLLEDVGAMLKGESDPSGKGYDERMATGGVETCRAVYTFCNNQKIKEGLCDDEQLEKDEKVEGITNPLRAVKKAFKAVGDAVVDVGKGAVGAVQSKVEGMVPI